MVINQFSKPYFSQNEKNRVIKTLFQNITNI